MSLRIGKWAVQSLGKENGRKAYEDKGVILTMGPGRGSSSTVTTALFPGFPVKGLHEFLKLGDRPLVTVVNGVVEKKDFTISDRDRVGIFPPIVGG